MSKRVYIYLILLPILPFIKGCITPYEPQNLPSSDSFMVIEGNIIQNGVTTVRISKTQPLDSYNPIDYIGGATVWVESDRGERYIGVQEGSQFLGDSKYLVDTDGIDPTREYKLVVKVGEKSYESDFVTIKESVPIDSVGYQINSDSTALTFYVNSHDPNQNSSYYMWSFTEDWEIHSPYHSLFEYDPKSKKIYPIQEEQNRFYCWMKNHSRSILVASTEHLSEDRVYRMPLLSVADTDFRLNYLYSMELTQIVIDKRGYYYWENVKKNSDQIGGLFSPQPSEIRGNIKSLSDPSEVVIGYISGAVATKKRLFFKSEEIGIYKFPYYCEMHAVGERNDLPIDSLYAVGFDVVDYFPIENESIWITTRCVDCRLFGTKEKPHYWPTDHN